MSISRSHDKNARLIEGLSRLLQGYENGEERSASIGKEIYLPGDTCPSGLVACDESKQECPGEEFRLEPGIYTNRGVRCYTRQGVARSRELSSQDKDTAVKGLRALVVEVAKLRDMNTEIDKMFASSANKVKRAIGRYGKARKAAGPAETKADDSDSGDADSGEPPSTFSGYSAGDGEDSGPGPTPDSGSEAGSEASDVGSEASDVESEASDVGSVDIDIPTGASMANIRNLFKRYTKRKRYVKFVTLLSLLAVIVAAQIGVPVPTTLHKGGKMSAFLEKHEETIAKMLPAVKAEFENALELVGGKVKQLNNLVTKIGEQVEIQVPELLKFGNQMSKDIALPWYQYKGIPEPQFLTDYVKGVTQDKFLQPAADNIVLPSAGIGGPSATPTIDVSQYKVVPEANVTAFLDGYSQYQIAGGMDDDSYDSDYSIY
jgi:hypothetical protein